MGVFKSLPHISFWVFFILILPCSSGDSNEIATSNNNTSSLPHPLHQERTNFSPFRPSIAVVVGVLTTMFSITFLLLLYAKHCKGGNAGVFNHHTHTGGLPSTARRNSGIDRAVIESLPIFRFESLRGQKDGLECAVCLAMFKLTEVLRLLPKCKHAFHVECVDTWLDSHSTCPLCRYRVDPEDILLIEDNQLLPLQPPSSGQQEVPVSAVESQTRNRTESEAELNPGFRRVSGRHSSAGERELSSSPAKSHAHDLTSFRRSLDSAGSTKKSESVSISVGCFDRPRKDGSLLTQGLMADRKSFERRFEHRIIVSAVAGRGFHHRWSDVQPSDLLYLRSEMIISDNHRLSLGSSRPSMRRQGNQNTALWQHSNIIGICDKAANGSGRGVINSRSVSEITGLSRFSSRE